MKEEIKKLIFKQIIENLKNFVTCKYFGLVMTGVERLDLCIFKRVSRIDLKFIIVHFPTVSFNIQKLNENCKIPAKLLTSNYLTKPIDSNA